ncbi:hypothetical protein Tco_0656074 [Tanacetum coccineum]|uniref:Uncharacterized protein n=1 Tax=Tanacetum coccineum TaxID=301880 RepID=A0ABQ4X7S1_9ASTR
MHTIQKVHCGFVDVVNDLKTQGVIVVMMEMEDDDGGEGEVVEVAVVFGGAWCDDVGDGSGWMVVVASQLCRDGVGGHAVATKLERCCERKILSTYLLQFCKTGKNEVTPLFQTMMLQAPEDMGKDSAAPTDSHSTLIITQPSSSKPQKKKSRRKQRKDSGPTEPIPDEATN